MGAARSVQVQSSDVSLFVPEGKYGLLLGTNHTNHHDFLHLFPGNHCILGPICEYKLHPFLKGDVLLGKHRFWKANSVPIIPRPVNAKSKRYKLKVPHNVENLHEVRHAIRVRHIKSKNGVPEVINIPLKRTATKCDMVYKFDNKYITIYMKEFCKLTVSLEGVIHCGRNAEMMVFGKLDNFPDEDPMVTLNTYFGSKLCVIKDYFEVILLHV